jgi:hypothetical protein
VNLSCKGFFCVTVLYIHRIAFPSSFGFRPPRFRASRADHPPLRYRANHPYIVALLMPNAEATISGLCPSCTLATPRFRNSVSIQ